jgi:predicted TIM-barrel fold metal-dependent hydrolase
MSRERPPSPKHSDGGGGAAPRPINDGHCHFFSEQFFAALGRQRPPGSQQSAAEIVTTLGWDAPGPPEELADRWAQELDSQGVERAALIASVPGDEDSVSRAVSRHPSRFVGFFMLDPTAPDASSRAEHALRALGLRCICLFPAMQRYSLHDARVAEIVGIAARHAGTAVFVHCGALSVGVRKKLGLPSRFDVRYGNPLDIHALAAEHPGVPFIIPHFGAGLLREALLVADLCPNVFLDTSSTNRWMAYHPSLTLTDVFRQALKVAGPDRLLFGTDSSFFPRGWTREVYAAQASALEADGVDEAVGRRFFGENFDRLFPPGTVLS